MKEREPDSLSDIATHRGELFLSLSNRRRRRLQTLGGYLGGFGYPPHDTNRRSWTHLHWEEIFFFFSFFEK
jgi:hypothetical protein